MRTFKKSFGFVFVLVIVSLVFLCALKADNREQQTPVKPAVLLTEENLTQMRAEITANGWTFEIGFNPATQYTLGELCGGEGDQASFNPGTGGSVLPSVPVSRESADLIIKLPSTLACVATAVANQTTTSSWPFASTDMFESVIKLKDGVTVSLSELWLLDCNPYGWNSTDGWFASDIFFNTGAVLSSNFPPGTLCSSAIISYQADTWHFCKNGYSVAPTTNIKQGIYDYGSVACLVYADTYFQAYMGGVFNHSSSANVNHFVTLCGWDDTKGAWRLKNTWGTGWGESGYMWITYGCHNVGWAANYLVY